MSISTMMPWVDVSIPTLFLAIIAVSATLACAIATVAWRNSRELLLWSWALGSNALAYVLFALRGQVSELWSVVLANTAIALALALFRAGIACSQGQIPSWLRICWPVPLVAISFHALLDNPSARVGVGCSIFALQSFACLLALSQRRGQTRGMGQYILMAGFLLVTLVFLIRIAAVLNGDAQAASIQASSWLQTVSFFAVLIALVLLGTGLTLLVHERAMHELADSRGLLRQQNSVLQQYSTELGIANLRLGELSLTDSLTGVGNRRRLDESLRAECARSRREGKPLALLMVDVDHFKLYNDCYGHQAGDGCLAKVAVLLQEQSRRAADLVARYGGEEFVVIAYDTRREGAQKLGEAICRAIAALGLPHALSPHGRVTVSIGAAVMMPGNKLEPGELIRQADAALYRAKNDGRNCIRLGQTRTAVS
jgi:diguanylate cyclase (GGDEF)-like protein